LPDFGDYRGLFRHASDAPVRSRRGTLVVKCHFFLSPGTHYDNLPVTIGVPVSMMVLSSVIKLFGLIFRKNNRIRLARCLGIIAYAAFPDQPD